ncbi:hypothetical protein LCGC14_1890100 [marine sediment metagenome]|uniref:Uncharacterized protein n=1 Tax=marine sediment metagenome TaxID=412755 RepID=A0A0F9GMY2_9ZZZZ
MPRFDKDKKDAKSINIEQVVSYLNHTFAKTSEEVFGSLRPKAIRGTTLYNYQVDHCYLIDEIQRGPIYMLPKVISNANDNIAAMKIEEQTMKEATK